MGREKQTRPLDRSDPEGLGALIAAFLENLRVRNFSAQTISNRGWNLAYFGAWAADRNILRAAEVTRPMLERYQRWLTEQPGRNGKPITWGTQAARLIALKTFFQWLARSNTLALNPASELELPRRQRRLPKTILSAAEMASVLALPDVETEIGLRDRALLELLYSTGMRRSEATGLEIFDLDRQRSLVIIRKGKGGKERVVPIGEKALGWVEAYLNKARPELVAGAKVASLFVTKSGLPLQPKDLSELVGRYLKEAGFEKVGACHLLRHTMATLMHENGADIRFIQELLGHAELSTTQIYTRVSIRKLQEVHKATHPEGLPPEGLGEGEAEEIRAELAGEGLEEPDADGLGGEGEGAAPGEAEGDV